MAILDLFKPVFDSFAGANTLPGDEVQQAKVDAIVDKRGDPTVQAMYAAKKKQQEEEEAARKAELAQQALHAQGRGWGVAAQTPQQNVADFAEGTAKQVAPAGVLEAAEKEVGTPTEKVARNIAPKAAAYQPQPSQAAVDRDPAKALVDSNTQFATDLAQKKTEEAKPTGALANATETEKKTDFGAKLASNVATLATFGAMLATGVGIPFALAAAASAWAGTGDMRNREEQAGELRDKGYNNAEISNFVHKGVLQDVPMSQMQEKNQQEMALRKAQTEAAASKASGKGGGQSEEAGIAAYRRSYPAIMDFTRNYGEIGENYPMSKEGEHGKIGANFNKLMASTMGASDATGLQKALLDMFNPEVGSAVNLELQFLSGILRRESGAAVSRSEWENYGNIFFPRPHDSEKDLRRKAIIRKLSTDALNPAGRSSPEDFDKLVKDIGTHGVSDVIMHNGEQYIKTGAGNYIQL